MATLRTEVKTPPHLVKRMLMRIAIDNPTIRGLPDELLEQIVTHARNTGNKLATQNQTKWSLLKTSPAYTPPATGACPLMGIPSELRRQIFAESLPARDIACHPKCDDEKQDREHHVQPHKDCLPKLKPNPTANLMVLNKQICSEIAEVIYEERCFVIHVHEGLRKGGIEFLHAGRQPLQYQDCIDDQRFWKFKKGDDFSFRRLKKIRVQIHPAQKDISRHTAINTYFINLALCRLLDRSGEKKSRITSLTIEFVSPQDAGDRNGCVAIQRAEQYWWDPDKRQPRETSVHRLPNIELVLRPFAILTGCHSVSINLPGNLSNNVRLATFVSELQRSMTSKLGTLFSDDDLEMKIESARSAMEEYVNYTLHGTKYHDVEKMTEDEIRDPAQYNPADFDHDDDYVLPSRKHDLSPLSKEHPSDSRLRKRKLAGWQKLEDGFEESGWDFTAYEQGKPRARKDVVKESAAMAKDLEGRQLQEAINASLEREVHRFEGRDAWGQIRAPAFGCDTPPYAQHKSVLNRDHPRRLRSATQGVPSLAEEPLISNNVSSFHGTGRTLESPAPHSRAARTLMTDLGSARRTTAAQATRERWGTHLHNHGRPAASASSSRTGRNLLRDLSPSATPDGTLALWNRFKSNYDLSTSRTAGTNGQASLNPRASSFVPTLSTVYTPWATPTRSSSLAGPHAMGTIGHNYAAPNPSSASYFPSPNNESSVTSNPLRDDLGPEGAAQQYLATNNRARDSSQVRRTFGDSDEEWLFGDGQ